MEPATTEDLLRASTQGTILAVKVDGKVYGEGYISVTATASQKMTRILGAFGVIAIVGLVIYWKREWLRKFLSGRSKGMESLETSFGEAMCKPSDDSTAGCSEHVCAPVVNEHQEEMDRLTAQLTQERVRHELECIRKDEYIKQLEKRIPSEEDVKEAKEEASQCYGQP